MTIDYTIDPAWQEEPKDKTAYKKVRAIREATAGCPCDACEWRDTCRTECHRFKTWVQTGRSCR